MFRNILFVFVGGPLFLPLALAYLAAVVVAAVVVLRLRGDREEESGGREDRSAVPRLPTKSRATTLLGG